MLRTLLLLISVAAFAQIPEGHPKTGAEDRRQKLSTLTGAVRGGEAVAAQPVPRKNFIDDHIFGKMSVDRVPHAPLASDEEFFRRIHIDLTGRIGDSADLEKFLADKDPAKRDKLIDALTISPAFKARWTYWFGDLAKTAANRVGNDGKNLFYKWVYDNKPQWQR